MNLTARCRECQRDILLIAGSTFRRDGDGFIFTCSQCDASRSAKIITGQVSRMAGDDL